MTPQHAEVFDVVVIGGGPAGATAAHDLARAGRRVALLDRAGRIKPCGGAIPPRAITEFAIPDAMLACKVNGARIISPQGRTVAMPIDDGFVGMVDREVFDEWLRERARGSGAERITGKFDHIERTGDGPMQVVYHDDAGRKTHLRARLLIGADGANSRVARQEVPCHDEVPFVFAYHEIIESPMAGQGGFDPMSCDVIYRGSLSPDFYTWVFPHGPHTSIGVGSANKGFSLRDAVQRYRTETGLDQCATVRREGAPIPLRPLRRWDNGRDVLLAGDAAGVVAPASGEGIFYAMTGGRLAAQSAIECLDTGKAKALSRARRRFMRVHGPVFWILGIMQSYWYTNDKRRERFVAICRDLDVQQLTWDAYMNKELVKARPLAHARIFFKNLAHLAGVAPI